MSHLYRITYGTSYHGPIELVLEIRADRAAEAATRARQIIWEPFGWLGVDLPLPGLQEGEKATLHANPAYFPTPERVPEEEN